MKAFFDKYKYILALGLILVAVVIVAVVSSVAGKDTAEKSSISYPSSEHSSFADTESRIGTTASEESTGTKAPPATTVTDKTAQASIQTTVQTTLPIGSQTDQQTSARADTYSTKPGTASALPAQEVPASASSTAAVKPATTASSTTAPPEPSTTAKAATTAPKPAATAITTVATTAKATTKATSAATASPAPEPDNQPTEKYDSSCTFVIECKTILSNKDKLRKGLEKYVPDNGIIYSGTVGFDSGESVYDILRRICDENKIQMESSFTPAFGSYYVEGINNLYEFDCGGSSGWMYSVNGVFPNYGCSSYKPQNNDKIAFRYTCELGYDL